ncbi:MAG: DUF1416 domain-containing protein [Streptosporangiaceae bacterium]
MTDTQAAAGGCGAPAGGVAVANAGNQAIVQGTVTRAGAPMQVGYARLLNSGGDFVAEVPLGDDGGFRFFAAPGDWTLRVLAPGGVRADRTVTAAIGEIRELEVAL